MFKRILVPVDGSDSSNNGLLVALRMAREADGEVCLVHVLEQLAIVGRRDPGEPARQAAFRAGSDILQRALALADSGEVPAHTRLLEPDGSLGECIARAAVQWQAHVVVIGTHGRRGVRQALLGTGAEQIARLSPVPVLLVPGRDGS